MFDSYFTPVQQGSILAALCMTLGALWAHHKDREQLSIGLVLSAALVLRLMAAQLDPFLNIWDESVHAVVAKNMVSTPFTPMLYTDTALGLSYEWWTSTHIWLHKQPFFLWLMALSIGTLGNTVLALRLPSVLCTTALVYFTYGIAKVMLGRSVGFAAALLMTWSFWFLMLVQGSISTDHNDAIFISMVGGSFWGWSRWRDRMSNRKALVIGLFIGCAVLTKWLPGFLLMGGWAVVAVLDRKRRNEELRWMTVAMSLALVIAVPWQVSAWVRFPDEMRHEMAFNSLHFFEAVEGHLGDHWFYFRTIEEQFDPIPQWLVFTSFVAAALLSRRKDMRIMALVSVVVVYTFYSFAATKMSTYPMLVIPFFFIGLGALIHYTTNWVHHNRWRSVICSILVLVGAGALFHMERMQLIHTAQAARDPYYSLYRGANEHNLEVLLRLKQQVGAFDEGLVFGVPFPASMNMMFFHGGQALSEFPSPEKAQELLDLGRRVIVVDAPVELQHAMPEGTEYFDTGGNGFQIPPL